MVPSLRGRLVCFYCGCRSAQIRKGYINRWQCEKCEAVNHLDENGEITDPPAAENISNVRYAQQIQRPTSPVFDGPEETLFCQTCLKNQHIFSESLASYFPAQDAPNYADYEKHYPTFRQELEERYPQVCEECEPRVRERIQATGYAAKTDHLRRIMERTGRGGVAQIQSGWKRVLVFIGGTAWFLSNAGQIAWSGLALVAPEREYDGLIDEDTSSLRSVCLHQAMHGSALSLSCAGLMDPVARFALLLGVLSLWWNPRLQERLNRAGGRMCGIQEYYKLQGILLAARCLAWNYIPMIAQNGSSVQTTMGIHSGLLFFGGLLTSMSFRAIGIDYTPRVIFQDTTKPLISRNSQPKTVMIGPETPNHFLHQPKPYAAQSSSSNRPFRINDLAPASRQQSTSGYQHPYRPPTPPPEEGDDEAMDWTPTQQATLRPATLYRPSTLANKQTVQSPFRGHLPADVVSMEHRLRNPPNKPTFRKASETTKQNFFKHPTRNPDRDQGYISDSGTEYEPSLAETVSPPAFRFADPKFRFQSDHTADTGLERLLANTFSLNDEPSEIRALHQIQTQSQRREGNRFTISRFEQWHRLPIFVLLLTSYLVWNERLRSPFPADQGQSRLTVLLLAALASIRSLVLVLRRDSIDRNASDFVIHTTELLVSILLVYSIAGLPLGSLMLANDELLDIIGLALIAILAVQELWMFTSSFQTAPASDEVLNHSSQGPPPTTESPPSHQYPSSNRNGSQVPTFTPLQPIQRSIEPAPRTTRSKTVKNNGAITGSGFGSLSLGGSGDKRNDQLAGIGSLSLGQPRRNHRNGMW